MGLRLFIFMFETASEAGVMLGARKIPKFKPK